MDLSFLKRKFRVYCFKFLTLENKTRPANADQELDEEDEEMRLYTSRMNQRSNQQQQQHQAADTGRIPDDSRPYPSGYRSSNNNNNYRPNTVFRSLESISFYESSIK